jgi:hypothetical protein
MTDPTALLCIGFVFGSAMLIIYLVQSSYIEDRQKEAQRALEKFEGKCPVCSHDQFTAGFISSAYFNYDSQGNNKQRSQVIVFRCENCGHLIPFANPEQSIKRNPSITDQ